MYVWFMSEKTATILFAAFFHFDVKEKSVEIKKVSVKKNDLYFVSGAKAGNRAQENNLCCMWFLIRFL